MSIIALPFISTGAAVAAVMLGLRGVFPILVVSYGAAGCWILGRFFA